MAGVDAITPTTIVPVGHAALSLQIDRDHHHNIGIRLAHVLLCGRTRVPEALHAVDHNRDLVLRLVAMVVVVVVEEEEEEEEEVDRPPEDVHHHARDVPLRVTPVDLVPLHPARERGPLRRRRPHHRHPLRLNLNARRILRTPDNPPRISSTPGDIQQATDPEETDAPPAASPLNSCVSKYFYNKTKKKMSGGAPGDRESKTKRERRRMQRAGSSESKRYTTHLDDEDMQNAREERTGTQANVPNERVQLIVLWMVVIIFCGLLCSLQQQVHEQQQQLFNATHAAPIAAPVVERLPLDDVRYKVATAEVLHATANTVAGTVCAMVLFLCGTGVLTCVLCQVVNQRYKNIVDSGEQLEWWASQLRMHGWNVNSMLLQPANRPLTQRLLWDMQKSLLGSSSYSFSPDATISLVWTSYEERQHSPQVFELLMDSRSGLSVEISAGANFHRLSTDWRVVHRIHSRILRLANALQHPVVACCDAADLAQLDRVLAQIEMAHKEEVRSPEEVLADPEDVLTLVSASHLKEMRWDSPLNRVYHQRIIGTVAIGEPHTDQSIVRALEPFYRRHPVAAPAPSDQLPLDESVAPKKTESPLSKIPTNTF